ncbi:MAG: SWIM zinc finger family protein, partial [Ardenticatenaceae bacterium]
MDELPELSELEVARWVGTASLGKGRPYARSGMIMSPRRTGMTLKAQCQGTMAYPYRVEVTLGEEDIVAAACSCLVGYDGRCKHVAALLLTWLDKPDAFLEVEPLDKSLERRSKQELIALLRQISGLARCLPETEDPAQREAILRILFDTYAWDVNFGGIGMGDEAPEVILEQATPAEKQQVANWVRDGLPVGDDWSSHWRRSTYGGFLLELEAETLDDETFLRIAREMGRLA